MGSNYDDLIRALAPNRGSQPAGSVKSALLRLCAEIRSRGIDGSKESLDFHLSAYAALERIKGSAHLELRLAATYDCLQFFFENARYGEALEAASKLRSLAIKSQDSEWMQRAEIAFGVIYGECGRVGEAIEHYAQALEIPSHARWLKHAVGTFINLGVTLNYGSLYREAIPCFKRALALCNDIENSRQYEATALCNLAQSFHNLEEYDAAYDAISRCLAISIEPRDAIAAYGRTAREFTFVQIALELSRFSDAKTHALQCRVYSQRAGTSRARFLSDVCDGLLEVYAGVSSSGLAKLEETLGSCAPDLTLRRQVVLAALVKAYDEASQPELALARLQELLGYVRQIRERGLFALNATSGFVTTSGNAYGAADLKAFDHRAARLRALVAERSRDTAVLEMFERLAIAADLREEETGEHGFRVGALSALVARELNWTHDAVSCLELAARLHDVGKIGVPDRILLNSQALQQAQRKVVEAHAIVGAEMLSRSSQPELRIAEEVARCHHEWWNGEGYPSKLAGKRIPIQARIVALADVFDALTHGRPFSPPWTVDAALAEIRSRRGTQFDPELTDLFLQLMEKLISEHEDLDAYLARASRNSPFLQARNKIRRMLAEEREVERRATTEGNQTRH